MDERVQRIMAGSGNGTPKPVENGDTALISASSKSNGYEENKNNNEEDT
jgi:hypothetical protein